MVILFFSKNIPFLTHLDAMCCTKKTYFTKKTNKAKCLEVTSKSIFNFLISNYRNKTVEKG